LERRAERGGSVAVGDSDRFFKADIDFRGLASLAWDLNGNETLVLLFFAFFRRDLSLSFSTLTLAAADFFAAEVFFSVFCLVSFFAFTGAVSRLAEEEDRLENSLCTC
jgi:hypothetical protein